MSCGAMDQLEMVDVCLKCYERQKCDQGSVERLRKDGCCNYAQHQWSRKPCDSVTTVIDGSGIAYIAGYIIAVIICAGE